MLPAVPEEETSPQNSFGTTGAARSAWIMVSSVVVLLLLLLVVLRLLVLSLLVLSVLSSLLPVFL